MLCAYSVLLAIVFQLLTGVVLLPHQPTLALFSVCVVFLILSDMVYNVEQASGEDRLHERERQKRLLANIPRNSQNALFLAPKAAEILEVQFRVEDALLLIGDAASPPGDHPASKSAAQHLRLLVPQLATVVGQHALAAKFNIECANEALMVEDELPGISPTQFKAVRTLYRQQEETTDTNSGRLEKFVVYKNFYI